jgi:antitoxin component of MazEF toxin-antitoxin module
MIQRIIKVGKDLVVALPDIFINSLQLNEGDEVCLIADPGQNRILIHPVGHSPDIDREFATQASEFIRDYKPALEKLAKLEE